MSDAIRFTHTTDSRNCDFYFVRMYKAALPPEGEQWLFHRFLCDKQFEGRSDRRGCETNKGGDSAWYSSEKYGDHEKYHTASGELQPERGVCRRQ